MWSIDPLLSWKLLIVLICMILCWMMMMIFKMPIASFIIFVWNLLNVLQNQKLSFKSTKSKAKFQKVKLEKDDLIAKLDEANNLNENFKIQISSLVDKIKSLEEQLVDLLLGNRVVLKLLMFVTIVVLQVTLVRIVSSCFLISECQIGFILCLKALYLFLVSY